MEKTHVFVCYARADKRWLDELQLHLKPFEAQGDLVVFYDEVVSIGQNWHDRIQGELKQAHVVVLLVSKAFLASEYITSSELPVILHRNRKDGLRILPVLIDECAFDQITYRFPDPKTGPQRLSLSTIQAVGSLRQPLAAMKRSGRDSVLTKLVRELIPRRPAKSADMDALVARVKSVDPNERVAKVVGAKAIRRQVTAGPPTPANPWTNSLGMKFVSVPGTSTLFCIWPTRVRDYSKYAEANKGIDGSWMDPMFLGVPVTPGLDHPVVNVSWEDADRFCRWLTQTESEGGTLARGQRYRLPTDWEWSTAVGLSHEPGKTPVERDCKVPGVYPWGTQWPPPAGAGNFADETSGRKFGEAWNGIEGYDDGFATTSPVGSFMPSKEGLYDLAGNVWEWCEDWWDAENNDRVLRGGSWDGSDPRYLLTSCRINLVPSIRYITLGFRVVLVGDAAAR